MKLQNNIVSDSEMEITFDSFNPTAGRLADCLLGFSIQVQLTLVLALSGHTQGHTATATTRRTSAPGLRPAPVTHRPPHQPAQCTAGLHSAAARGAGGLQSGRAEGQATPTGAPSGRGCLGGGHCCDDRLGGTCLIVATAEAEASGCWVTQFPLLMYIWATICIVFGQNIAKIKPTI